MRLVLILIALMAVGCAVRPTTAGQPLRVATWNLEWLAEKDGAGCRPRTEAEYAALREFADGLDADVIAFQEVESVAAVQRVFDPARYEIVFETRPTPVTTYACRGKPGLFSVRQAVGFAVRKGLRFDRSRDLTELGLDKPDLRTGVDLTVHPKHGRPLRLLVVHLKSGCSSGSTNDACYTLRRQVPVLEGWIDDRAKEEVRFAVVGDFNRRLAAPGDDVWLEIDDGDPTNADLTLAAGEQAATCDPRYGQFIDHIVLDRRAGADLADFTEATYSGPRLSDHCAIVASLK
jgi:endonuclease/exonuclease/phosphatase family metal-dependent hydrolase